MWTHTICLSIAYKQERIILVFVPNCELISAWFYCHLQLKYGSGIENLRTKTFLFQSSEKFRWAGFRLIGWYLAQLYPVQRMGTEWECESGQRMRMGIWSAEDGNGLRAESRALPKTWTAPRMQSTSPSSLLSSSPSSSPLPLPSSSPSLSSSSCSFSIWWCRWWCFQFHRHLM